MGTVNTASKTIFGLMRHAKTQWNLEKRIQGQNDSILCADGIEQAVKWRKIIKSVRSWDRIVTSGLSRSIQTAEIINRDLELPTESNCGLNEQNWGDWNGKTDRELLGDLETELTRRMSMGWQFRPPGGEDRYAVWERSRMALSEIAGRSPGQNILVIAHGGVIKCLLYGVLGKKFLPEEPRIIKQYHLHFLSWKDGRLSLDQLNAVRLG
jgi:probable phosphoglycerate mutase